MGTMTGQFMCCLHAYTVRLPYPRMPNNIQISSYLYGLSGVPNTVKIPAEVWIETAKEALVDDGLEGVKIDRLAKKLGVTRGGFYHHFEGRSDLLDRLIDHWAGSNDFIPRVTGIDTPHQAVDALHQMADTLIAEQRFLPAFDLAVREWARIDPRIEKTVRKVDKARIARLTRIFSALGYAAEEAVIRARVFYFHQIGFYRLGHHRRQSKAERRRNTPIYLKIVCGPRYDAALTALEPPEKYRSRLAAGQ